MSDHMMRKVPRKEDTQPRVRTTRVEQQAENMHIVVQSTVPTQLGKQINSKYNAPKIKGTQGRYTISIDENDGSNIDVIVNMHKNQETDNTHRKHNELSPQIANIIIQNKDDIPSQSRIRIEKDRQSCNYQIKYSNKNDMSQITGLANSKNDSSQAYKSAGYETVHTIRISENSHCHSQRCFNQNYASMTNTQPMFTSAMRKDREEKSFMLAGDASNRKGKIIKNNNGDSSKDLQQTENKQQNTVKKQQVFNDQQMQQINLLPNHRQNNTQHNYFQHYQPQQRQINRFETPRQNPKNQRVIQQHTNHTYTYTQPRSPQNRRNSNNNNEPMQRSLSPMVVQYQPPYQDNQQIQQQSTPIFIDEGYYGAYQRQKIFKNVHNYDNTNSKNDRSKDDDRMRTAPTPIEKSLQKKVQESQWPPSYKDIPLPNNSKPNNKQLYSQIMNRKPNLYSNKIKSRQKTTKTDDSPIIVPVQKLPETSRKKYSIPSAKVQPKRVKLSMSSVNKTLNIVEQSPKIDEATAQTDRFVISKQRYLDKLQRQEREKSRLGESRTLSRSRHSLSPQCQRITNRLHYTHINKQPCPKLLDYMGKIKRMQMREMLADYSFIRRYLSDKQIWQILNEFEKQGIPERKWPSKLVDLVYEKLKSFKIY